MEKVKKENKDKIMEEIKKAGSEEYETSWDEKGRLISKKKTEMKKGRIKITPFKRSQLGPASIDLSLDDKFRIFDLGHEMVIDESTDYRDMSRFITIKKFEAFIE